MRRRDLLATGTAAALGTLAAPRLSLAQSSRVLRFVPQANLSTLDAVAGTQYVVRNASLMVWDTLYGIDSKIEPHPQMAEGHENSPDFKVWTFKLRDGLRFHDNEPVLARDVVASLNRWMARDTMGQRIKATLDKTTQVDTDGFAPPFSFAADFPAPGLNRVFNYSELTFEIKGGKDVIVTGCLERRPNGERYEPITARITPVDTANQPAAES